MRACRRLFVLPVNANFEDLVLGFVKIHLIDELEKSKLHILRECRDTGQEADEAVLSHPPPAQPVSQNRITTVILNVQTTREPSRLVCYSVILVIIASTLRRRATWATPRPNT